MAVLVTPPFISGVFHFSMCYELWHINALFNTAEYNLKM